MPFKKIIKTVKRVADTARGAVKSAASSQAKASAPKLMAQLGQRVEPSVAKAAEAKMPKGIMGKIAKSVGKFKFKDGGAADKTGRAMKKTTADAKGRAMTKAPKKMMGGGMMKGYAGGGDVTCGKATRGYGAARKGK